MNYEKDDYSSPWSSHFFKNFVNMVQDFCATHKSITCRHEETTSVKIVCLEPILNSKYVTIQCLSIVVAQNILEK